MSGTILASGENQSVTRAIEILKCVAQARGT